MVDLHRKQTIAMAVPLSVRGSLAYQTKQWDVQIDTLMYELYELTEEIALIKGVA